MITFKNAQFWRALKSGGVIGFVGDAAQSVVVPVKSTVPVKVFMQTAYADGLVEEDSTIFVAYLLPGDNTLRVSHGAGFVLIFEFEKGLCSVYDDRAHHLDIAPVGVTFTRFEKMGNRQVDPVQVIMHRDAVRRRLEGQRDRANGVPDKLQLLQGQVDVLTELLAKITKGAPSEQDQSADNSEPGDESGAT